jgi:cupin 2 domain-containing protein
MKSGNIYAAIPRSLPDEIFETIVVGNNVTIERIVSKGHASPESGWYDQEINEWVIVLKGKALLAFADAPSVYLTGGEYINIPAHKKHKVQWTDPDSETIWLAVHY